MKYLKLVKEKGLSTTWMSKQLGISQPLMYMKLAGKRGMTPEEEQKVADLLGVDEHQTTILDRVQYLPEPNDQLSESAYLLIVYKTVSRKWAMDQAYIMNFPEQVRRLRNLGALIETTKVERTNKYGRAISYAEYKNQDQDKLIEIYLGLINQPEAEKTR